MSLVVIKSVALAVTAVGGLALYEGQQTEPPRVAASTVAISSETVLPTAVLAEPKVTTGNASATTRSTATLHGVVGTNSTETSYWFEYSADPLLGRILLRKTPRIVLITRAGNTSVETTVSGLMSSTTYYFRIVAENSSGIVEGERSSFKTI